MLLAILYQKLFFFAAQKYIFLYKIKFRILDVLLIFSGHTVNYVSFFN